MNGASLKRKTFCYLFLISFVFFIIIGRSIAFSNRQIYARSYKTFVESSFEQISGWYAINFQKFWPSFLRSCQTILARHDSKSWLDASIYSPQIFGKIKDWKRVCFYAKEKSKSHKSISNETIRHFFENYFRPIVINDDDSLSSLQDGRLFYGHVGIFSRDFSASENFDSREGFTVPVLKTPPNWERSPLKYMTASEVLSIRSWSIVRQYTTYIAFMRPYDFLLLEQAGEGVLHTRTGVRYLVHASAQNNYPLLPPIYLLHARDKTLGYGNFIESNKNNNKYFNYFLYADEGIFFFTVGWKITSSPNTEMLVTSRNFYPPGIPMVLSFITKKPYGKNGKVHSSIVIIQDRNPQLHHAQIFQMFSNTSNMPTMHSPTVLPSSLFTIVPKNVNIENN